MKALGTNKFAFYAEIDVEDSDSDIYNDETDSEMADFIVSDEDVQGSPPPDHKSIDSAWTEWKPTSPGGKSFKETIDMIERNLSK
jgi:hypothetical protein